MANEPATRSPLGTAQEVFWTSPQGQLVGLSTDTKPTTRPDGGTLRPGVEFREWDTFLAGTVPYDFYWDGTTWRAKLVPAAAATLADLVAAQNDTNALLRDVLTELTAMRLVIQETYNDGRVDQTDYREAALTYLDRPDSEDQ